MVLRLVLLFGVDGEMMDEMMVDKIREIIDRNCGTVYIALAWREAK